MDTRPTRRQGGWVCVCWSLCALLAACGDDQGHSGVLSTTSGITTGMDGSDEDSTTGGEDTIGDSESSGSTTGEPPPPVDACDMSGMFGAYALALPTAPYNSQRINPLDVCNDAALIDVTGDDKDRLNGDPEPEFATEREFDVWLYRPDDGQGEWPDAPEHPVIFFIPGGGQNVVDPNATDYSLSSTHWYLPMFEPVVEAGAVVIGVQPASSGWSSGMRRAALAC